MPAENQEIYFMITIIGIILGLLLVGIHCYDYFFFTSEGSNARNKKWNGLKTCMKRKHSVRNLEIQESTFRTIAQELHDNIGQMLSVAKLSLSVLPIEKEHAAFEQLKNSQQMLNKAIGDLSNLTKGLHTERIAQIGLGRIDPFEIYALKKIRNSAGPLSTGRNRRGV
jgi:glucose-6-phosphate-specific signal transduction histidine kinase